MYSIFMRTPYLNKHSSKFGCDYHREIGNNSESSNGSLIPYRMNSQRRWYAERDFYSRIVPAVICFYWILLCDPRFGSQRDEGCSEPATLYRKRSTWKFIMHDCGYFAALRAPILLQFPLPYTSISVRMYSASPSPSRSLSEETTI